MKITKLKVVVLAIGALAFMFSCAPPKEVEKTTFISKLINKVDPLNMDSYKINILQRSNIADDNITILPSDNMNPVMSDAEIKDLVFQSLKAEAHFKNIFGRDKEDFSLDLEFKIDSEDTDARQVYIKQARPDID